MRSGSGPTRGEEDKSDHARERYLHPEVYPDGAQAFDHPGHEALLAQQLA